MLHIGFKKRSAGPVAGALILGTAFVILGAFMITVGVNNYRDGKATDSWPATNGLVLSSVVKEDSRTVRDNGRTRTETTYEPIVRYEYTVDGTVYSGGDITAGGYGGGLDRAYRVTGRYPVGIDTTVYYDPDHPDRAVLEPGADVRNVYLFGGGGAVFGIVGLGAFGFVGLLVRRRRQGI